MPLNRTVNANCAPRCQHTKANGAACAAPARRGRRFCCFHDSAAQRNKDFVLPIIEDAHSLQVALNKILQALLDKRIDQRTATTLLYGLQLALANMKELKHEQFLDKCDRERAQREAYAQAQAAAELEDEEEDEEYEDDEQGEDQEEEASEAEQKEAEASHSSVSPCLRGDSSAIGDRQSSIDNGFRPADPIARSPDAAIPAPKFPACVEKVLSNLFPRDQTFDIEAGAENHPPVTVDRRLLRIFSGHAGL